MKIYWYIKHRNFGGLSLLTGGAWIPQQLESFRNDIQNITRIYNLNFPADFTIAQYMRKSVFIQNYMTISF